MTQETLNKRIKTTTDLRGIVGTMKMLSSVSVGQFEKASQSLKQYTANLDLAFQGLFSQESFHYEIPHSKIEKPRILALIIGSDNGLVGRFNRDILDYAKQFLTSKTDSNRIKLLTVGKRMALIAQNSNYPVIAHYSNSNTIQEISSLSGILLTKINHIVSQEHFDNVWFFYNIHQATGIQTVAKQLIPFDGEIISRYNQTKWPGRSNPLLSEDLDLLFSALVHEYLGIQLAQALTDSLSCEHYTRMIHMQQAEKNIDEKLDELNLIYQQARQNQITDELIDIVSGAEAINKTLDKSIKNA